MHIGSDQLDLRFGLSFEDLYSQGGLARLDELFLQQLQSANPALAERLLDARTNPGALTRKQHSDLLVELAPHVEDFIGELFGISREVLVRELPRFFHVLRTEDFSCEVGFYDVLESGYLHVIEKTAARADVGIDEACVRRILPPVRQFVAVGIEDRVETKGLDNISPNF